MRAPHSYPRIQVPEAFLSNGHRSVQRVQQLAANASYFRFTSSGAPDDTFQRVKECFEQKDF